MESVQLVCASDEWIELVEPLPVEVPEVESLPENVPLPASPPEVARPPVEAPEWEPTLREMIEGQRAIYRPRRE
jgi:hypothetical protein